MEYCTLGKSGLKVSPLCIGTMNFGTPVGEKEGARIVHKALDLGINFIDTADMYEGYTRSLGSAGGAAEEILGKAIKGRRHETVLATKVGMIVGGTGPHDGGLSRKRIMHGVEQSLRRLGTDFIDLYYLHKPDPDTPVEETVATMNDLVRHGKILHMGISNHTAAETVEIILAARAMGMEPILCNQASYSILDRGIEEELVPMCRRYGVDIVAYRVLCSGVLSGKYKRGAEPPKDSRLAEHPGWVSELDERTFKMVETLEALAKEAGKTTAQYAISWTLARPCVTSAIVGIKRPEQVDDCVRAVGWEIPTEHMEKLERI